jgi:hypothetical protein
MIEDEDDDEDDCERIKRLEDWKLEEGQKAFSGTCPLPHLAQCRIGFQPVSPDHRTTRRESGLFAP